MCVVLYCGFMIQTKINSGYIVCIGPMIKCLVSIKGPICKKSCRPSYNPKATIFCSDAEIEKWPKVCQHLLSSIYQCLDWSTTVHWYSTNTWRVCCLRLLDRYRWPIDSRNFESTNQTENIPMSTPVIFFCISGLFWSFSVQSTWCVICHDG